MCPPSLLVHVGMQRLLYWSRSNRGCRSFCYTYCRCRPRPDTVWGPLCHTICSNGRGCSPVSVPLTSVLLSQNSLLPLWSHLSLGVALPQHDCRGVWALPQPLVELVLLLPCLPLTYWAPTIPLGSAGLLAATQRALELQLLPASCYNSLCLASALSSLRVVLVVEEAFIHEAAGSPSGWSIWVLWSV